MNLQYSYRVVVTEDINNIVDVYNSNASFLQTHLGIDAIDGKFIAQEITGMQQLGFNCCVITNKLSGDVVGVLDYKQDEIAYLSIIIIDSKYHGMGIATQVYRQLEGDMQQCGCNTVRIDVVNNYEDNVVGYWERLGFVQQEEIELEWGNNKSCAVVMRKSL